MVLTCGKEHASTFLEKKNWALKNGQLARGGTTTFRQRVEHPRKMAIPALIVRSFFVIT